MSLSFQIPVLVHTPAHSQVAGALTYAGEQALPPGTLVRVPLGQRELLGVVWEIPIGPGASTLDPNKLRPIAATLDGIAPLSPAWRQLVTFAAHYYQRSLGEVALAALPPQLRDLSAQQLARKLKKHAKSTAVIASEARQSRRFG
jgi:primosomal protein N' (replication factor Y)